MRTPSKILVGVTLAGLAAAGGAAFTGTGLATTAGSTQFVGGTVSQSVTGATLSNITYAYSDATNTKVNGITLTFTGGSADGKTVAAVASGGSGGTFECDSPGSPTNVSHSAFTPTASEAGYVGLTSLSVAVS